MYAERSLMAINEITKKSFFEALLSRMDEIDS